VTPRSVARVVYVTARRAATGGRRRVQTEIDLATSRRARADLALFHELVPPPSGGGHQFLRALLGELARRGLDVELNRISGGTSVCLVNSFNFDFARFARFARRAGRVVHRVDGPIGVYRGFDDGTDALIAALNARYADATVVQSRFSLAAHRELDIELRDPVVIPNTVDPAIFHPPASREPVSGRPVRLIAVSWSDNPNKGEETLTWLDRHLERSRYELTFVGRNQARFERIRTVDPVPSSELAELLRSHDAYVAPSRNDPCSNALLEALACGLPAVYLESGGHPELVGEAGLPFTAPEELPDVLDRLVSELDERRAAISVPALADVADSYLEVLGLASAG